MAGFRSPRKTCEKRKKKKAITSLEHLFKIDGLKGVGTVADLQTGEEGQQRVHPAAHAHRGVVHVHVEQQRGLTDVLHDGTVVLSNAHTKKYRCECSGDTRPNSKDPRDVTEDSQC